MCLGTEQISGGRPRGAQCGVLDPREHEQFYSWDILLSSGQNRILFLFGELGTRLEKNFEGKIRGSLRKVLNRENRGAKGPTNDGPVHTHDSP